MEVGLPIPLERSRQAPRPAEQNDDNNRAANATKRFPVAQRCRLPRTASGYLGPQEQQHCGRGGSVRIVETTAHMTSPR
jgi:hypothetical protein